MAMTTASAGEAPSVFERSEDGAAALALVLEPPPLPTPDPVTGKSPFYASCSPLYGQPPGLPSRKGSSSNKGGGGGGGGSGRAMAAAPML